MAGRRKKAEPTKRSALLGPWRQVCLSSVSMLAPHAAMPPARPASRDRVHYYSDGRKHVVDLEALRHPRLGQWLEVAVPQQRLGACQMGYAA